MKAIVLENYNPNLIELLKNFEIKDVAKPNPNQNQVLVKMKYASCNPSDIAFMRGMYNVKTQLPKILGFEGCGTVIDAGKSADAQKLLGKRVSCFVQNSNFGTWAEYLILEPENCIVLSDDISDEQGACLFVNPFTAFALYDLVKQSNSDCIVVNAALSRVASFLRVFAAKDNIRLVNIVRRDNHVELLKEQGEKFVLSSRNKTFYQEFAELMKEIMPGIFFDAVGGSATGKIMALLPDNCQTIVYGGLSGEPIGEIDVLDIIFRNKILLGFDLNKYIKSKNKQEFDELAELLQQKIITGDISTNIQSITPLNEVGNALRQYVTHMSDGKILFTFD